MKSIPTLGRGAGVLACVFLLPAIVELLRDPAQFFRSYLVAFLFVLAPALGALTWILIARLTGGRWGEALGDVLESAASTLPVLGLLFLPLLLGLEKVFPWAEPGWALDESNPLHQREFLRAPFFVGRAAFFFLVWIGLARLVSSRNPPGSFASRHQVIIGALGLIAVLLTVALSSVDWGMSLSPGWYSSIYGLLTIVAYALAGLSAAILLRLFLASVTGSELPRDTLQDLGSLLFASVLTWGYLSFSQLLIMWSANLPEEVTWYVERLGPGWSEVGVVLLIVHLFLPFFLLLMRKVKRRVASLAAVSALILAARLPETLWMIVPSFGLRGPIIHWLDVVLPVSFFAGWSFLVLRNLERGPATLESRSPGTVEAA